jgi:glycerate-2-kinase
MPDAAGAIVDRHSLNIFKDRVPNYLERLEKYDSHSLLEMAGNSIIITGDTHTNVGDIAVYLLA